MRRSIIALPVLFALLAADNPLEGDKFLQKADEKFEQAMTRAQESYAKLAGEAFETRLKTYRGILAAATKAGDFDRAAAVKARIEDIEAESRGRAEREEFDVLKIVPQMVVSSQEVQWHEDHMLLHAPATLRLRVPASATSFVAEGVLRTEGNVKFRVLVDRTPLFTSNEITQGGSVKIHVPLKRGSKIIELVSDPNGPDAFDHALWYRPRFEK